MLGLTLHPLMRYQWSFGASVVAIVALGVGAVALWWAYAALAARLSVAEVRAGWIAVFASTGLLLLFARTALLAQLASTVAVSLLAVTMVAPPSIGANASDAAALPFPRADAPRARPQWSLLRRARSVRPRSCWRSLRSPRRSLSRWRAADAVARVAAATLGVVLLLAPFVARGAIGYLADDRGYSEYEE